MIRFSTDINLSDRHIFSGYLSREKKAMRCFMISLSIACVAWVSASAALAIYSREVAVFIVEHF